MDRGRILVVEDDAHVAETVMDILECEGFSCRHEACGNHALQALREEMYDVLFTDVVMPGMDGFSLASQASLLWPRMGIVMASGWYTERRGPLPFKLLQKPYRLTDLIGELDRAVAAART